MKLFLSTAALVAAAGTASAVPVTFSDFTTNNGGFLNGDSSDSATVDGVTLTATADSGVFRSTGGGTGIDTGDSAGNNTLQVNTTESFDLVFDSDGTLTEFTIGLWPTSSSVTVTNEATLATATDTETNTGSGFSGGRELALNLGFSAGDVLRVDTVTTGSGGATGLSSGYRIQSITIDAVPEPASLALALAGGTLLLGRRRKG